MESLFLIEIQELYTQFLFDEIFHGGGGKCHFMVFAAATVLSALKLSRGTILATTALRNKDSVTHCSLLLRLCVKGRVSHHLLSSKKSI
jgi:hypothetical protein